MKEATANLIEELTYETRRKRRISKLLKILSFTVVVAAIVSVLLEILGYLEVWGKWFFLAQGILAVIGSMATASERYRWGLDRLKHSADASAIGPLAGALWMHNIDQKLVAGILTMALPLAKACDGASLTPANRGDLYNGLKLKTRDFADFQLAVLQALEQIGDEAAIPFVERLAEREAKCEKGERVKRAAIECLPALREAAARRREESTLLRPAGASDDLLRPAEGAMPDTQALLRAAENQH